MSAGPLAGVRVVELGGIGPAPHAAMMLAEGADVVRVRRPGGLQIPAEDVDLMHRGQRVVALDAGTDACVTPVLTWSDAARSEHLRARDTIVTRHGVDQAAPGSAVLAHPARPGRCAAERGHPGRSDLLVITG